MAFHPPREVFEGVSVRLLKGDFEVYVSYPVKRTRLSYHAANIIESIAWDKIMILHKMGSITVLQNDLYKVVFVITTTIEQ